MIKKVKIYIPIMYIMLTYACYFFIDFIMILIINPIIKNIVIIDFPFFNP